MKTVSEMGCWKLLSQPTNQQVMEIGLSTNASANERARAQCAMNKMEQFLALNLRPRAKYIFDEKTESYRKYMPSDLPSGSETMPVDKLFIPETYHVVGHRLKSAFGEMMFQ